METNIETEIFNPDKKTLTQSYQHISLLNFINTIKIRGPSVNRSHVLFSSNKDIEAPAARIVRIIEQDVRVFRLIGVRRYITTCHNLLLR